MAPKRIFTDDERHQRKLAANAKYKAANWEKIQVSRAERYKANPEVNKAWRQANPEKCRAASKRYRAEHPERFRAIVRKSRYGITQEQWDAMFAAQGSCCSICRRPEPRPWWHTDHCHGTNTVRGILCHHCNLMLGNAKDSVETLRAAIQYLTK